MNEPQITLTGNVAAPPSLRMAAGTPVTSFRIGATPRRYDKATDTWSDAETLWFTVTAWRALAEHCVTSLVKGDKVVVTGRLTQRSWTADDGTARAGLEVDAASVGLDLSRSSALSTRRGSARGADDGAVAPAERAEAPDERAEADETVGWAGPGRADDHTGPDEGEPVLPPREPSDREPVTV